MTIDSKNSDARRRVEDDIARQARIVRRNQWGARAPKKSLDRDWDYNSIVVHYTGHENLTTPAAIQQFDLEHQHWDDIAYHYAISATGTIYEGRELIYKGSHVKLQNTGKIGIVCMGDFDESWKNLFEGHPLSGDELTRSMVAALRNLTLILKSKFNIIYFGGHVEYGDTDVCPGSKLLPVVQAMREYLNFLAPNKKSLK